MSKLISKVQTEEIMIDCTFIRDWLGFKTFPTLVKAVQDGVFPRPDLIFLKRKLQDRGKDGYPGYSTRKRIRWHWRQGTILDWLRDQNASSAVIAGIERLKE